jgi:SNF2 family DNA or RNA helicase
MLLSVCDFKLIFTLTNQKKLIFSFLPAEIIGFSVEPFMMQELPDKSFSYDAIKVSSKLLNNHDYQFSEKEVELVKICEQIRLSNIHRKFRSPKVKEAQFASFLKETPEIERSLRAFVDKQIVHMLTAMHGEKVYMRKKASDFAADNPLLVEKDPAEIVYHFHKHADGIQYFITLKHRQKELKLNHKDQSYILSDNPCYLRVGKQVFHFNEQTDGKKLSPFIQKDQLEVPAKMEKSFVESFMLRVLNKQTCKLKGFTIEHPSVQMQVHLDLLQDIAGDPCLQLSFFYGKKRALPEDSWKHYYQLGSDKNPEHLLFIERESEQEAKCLKRLLSFGLILKKGGSLHLPDADATLENYLDLLRLLEAENKYHISGMWKAHRLNTKKPDLQIKVKSSEDWFDIHAVVKLGNLEIPFVALRENILSNNPYYLLPDGSTLLIPKEWMNKTYDLFKFSTNEEGLRIEKHHQALLSGHPIFGEAIKPHLNEMGKMAYSMEQIPAALIPSHLQATLRPYQKAGYDWLMHLQGLQLGACLADDMGLGKTLQVIALLSKFYEGKSVKKTKNAQLSLFDFPNHSAGHALPSLVIVTPSLLHNWVAELQKFAPQLHFSVYDNRLKNRELFNFSDAQIVLSTYGIVRNDISLLQAQQFAYIILDESQLIKNVRSLSFQAVKKLHAQHRIVLTGTPVENSLTDLWSQLTFLNPGLLGSYRFFKSEFVQPIEKQGDDAQLEKLRKIIQPFILRRTKEEVAKDLPALSHHVIYSEMAEEQKKLYEEVKSFYRNQILERIAALGVQGSQMTILKGLTELRLIANHPSMTGKDLSSGKFEDVIAKLDLLLQEKKKVLVFSQFVRHLDLFQAYYEKQGVALNRITGAVKNRKEQIKEFNEGGDARIFLISLRAGGVGLNLTASEHVFLLDPWWNPAVEDQAIARAHRIGQRKKVFSYRFISKDSIEEKIRSLQERKTWLADEIINNNPLRRLDAAQIEELFG